MPSRPDKLFSEVASLHEHEEVRMDTGKPVCEVVWIKDESQLIDAESYERAYGSDSRPEMRSGYYVARWPAGTLDSYFLHPKIVFLGPYGSRRDAEVAIDTMLGDR
jgi:hypothetical protein